MRGTKHRCSMASVAALRVACDSAALVRGVSRCVGTLPPDESGAMLAAALSAVARDDAAVRSLAKLVRAEAKRHNSAKDAATFATAGGVAAAVAAVQVYFPITTYTPPSVVNTVADGFAALADLAAAGGATHAAVIAVGAADVALEAFAHTPQTQAGNTPRSLAPLHTQACRLAGNLCFGGAHDFGDDVHLFLNALSWADDATSFRWAAHAVWNACTHSPSTRATLHYCQMSATEALVKGASRFPGAPRAYGLRALAYVILGSEERRQEALQRNVALVLSDAFDEPATAAAALLCVASVVGPCGTAHLARWTGVADRADGLANIAAKLASVALQGGGDAAAISAGIIAVARGARDPWTFRAAVIPLLREAIEKATRPRARKALGAALHALQPRRHLYNVGAEAEAAGRAVPKNMQILRKDLAQLPWVLARPGDVVVAPPLSETLLARLEAAGVAKDTLPSFGDVSLGRLALPEDILRTVLGYLVDAPWAVADERLRRSRVTRYREDDVTVCASLEDVAAAARANASTILKAEYSSSGLGARTVSRELTEQDMAWARNRLKADGVLTAEPWYDLETEVTLEWYEGEFCGVSRPIVDNGRWQGQSLGSMDNLAPDIVEHVFQRRWIEGMLAEYDVPGTCGSATCGVDVGIDAAAGLPGARALNARVLECNARTTMSHIALAAKRRFPAASRFLVVPTRDVAPHHLPLTEGEHFVAVLELGDESGPFPCVAPDYLV